MAKFYCENPDCNTPLTKRKFLNGNRDYVQNVGKRKKRKNIIKIVIDMIDGEKIEEPIDKLFYRGI